MSLFSAMYTSVTGLNTTSQELGIVSDNIANANTIGFKASRAAFEDILGMNLGSTGQVGLGAKLQAVQKILTQGALTSTGLATDLALQGPGFFIVEAGDGTQAFTRAGQFTIDESGFLVNLDSLRVQGFQADPVTGTVSGALGDLQIGDASAPPRATANLVINANLDSNSTPPADAAGNPIPYDPNDANSFNFATSTVIFDNLGNPIEATLHYVNTAPGQWDYHVVVDDGNIAGGTAGSLTEIGNGTLTFDPVTGAVTQPSTAVSFVPVGQTAAQLIDIDLSAMTSFGGASAVSFISQDGFAFGELANIQIDDDGSVVGAFTNGERRVLGQVAIADFSAGDKLERIGGNLFRETRDSGAAVIGEAGTGGRGQLVSGALELSNVDLANEFVRMIIAQRGFQAAGKAVTTADTLLGELMQLKR